MTSSDPSYPLYPIFAFLGFILSIIPLSWHIHAWNSGTCAYMIWTGTVCLIFFVNSIVWAGNVNNSAPVWCDISSKLIAGISVGIPASALCISRRLYYITAAKTVSITRDDKRRMVIADICIAAGAPAIIMALHYIVQGHRFDIYEDIGCYPTVYNTLPAYFLFFMWPIVFGIFSFAFSVMTLRSFWLRRLQFSQVSATNSSMTMSRYLRLILLALTDIICTLPLGIYTICLQNPTVDLQPWISWSDTHFNFSAVVLYPAVFWRSQPAFRISMELVRWLPVVCAFVFFALFGLAEEAKKHYKLAYWSIMRLFGIRPTPPRKDKPTPFHEGGYPWTKPDLKSVDVTSGTTTHILLSPTSVTGTTKKLDRSHSFSTSASTHVGGREFELELDTYKPLPIHHDIEKLAGLSSPTLSDTDTIYTKPLTYAHGYAPSSPNPTRREDILPDVPQSVSTWDSMMQIDTFMVPLSPGVPPPSPLGLKDLPPPPPRKDISKSKRVPVPPLYVVGDEA